MPEAEVRVSKVKAFRTKSGNTRFVLVDDEGGSIGRRYRRQDEIGTPWGITIDGQTMEDETVTLRDRDSLEQVRVPVAELGDELERRLAELWQSPKLLG